MIEITAVNNNLVKETVKLQQRKYRDKENKFLLEGFKSIDEAYRAGIEIENVFVLKGHETKYSFVNEKIILTNEAVLKKISTTETPPEAVAVGIQKHYSEEDLQGTQKVVLLENIRDLGNLGTVLRTAVAFGADAVVLYGECADIYNPKCVRSSVGNLWKIPVVNIKNFGQLKILFSKYNRIATLPRAKKMLREFSAALPLLVMFGSEAEGLSDELIGFATDEVKIEMAENVESLNLSVSCAVVLYKMFIV